MTWFTKPWLLFFSKLPIKVLFDNTFLTLKPLRICAANPYGSDHLALLTMRICINISCLYAIEPVADVFDLQGHGKINGVCYR